MTFDDHFPIDLAERPLRFESTQTNPARLVREQLQSVYRGHRKETDQFLTCLAQTRFQVQRVRDELSPSTDDSPCGALETIGEILQDLLDHHHVTIDDRTGETWSTELLDEMELRGHQTCDEITEPRIAYMELPVIRRQGRLIAKGAVLVDAPKRN
ncbi:MAG: hypothetical protein ACC628_04375 [Pirellulaceae bacterium]